MTEELDIDDITKCMSVFRYHLDEFAPRPGTYVINDENGRAVYWEGAHISVSYTIYELRLILFTSAIFFVYEKIDCSKIPPSMLSSCCVIIPDRINMHKNIYQGKTPYEMMVACDLALSEMSDAV